MDGERERNRSWLKLSSPLEGRGGNQVREEKVKV